MDPTLAAWLRSWPIDPWVVLPLFLLAIIYVRGWRRLRSRGALRFAGQELGCFLAGLTALFLALSSPLEPASFLLLQAHMVQHLLLMLAAPILLWLGEPFIPLLVGLPRIVRQSWVVPVIRLEEVKCAWQFLSGPGVAWLLFVLATWIWHLPACYEAALRSDSWHYLEHATFVLTGLLFWRPVLRPYPSRPRSSLWILIPYLLFADLLNTPLAALLTYSGTVLYPHYQDAPRLFGISALEDQALAGVLMWIVGALAYLAPLVWIASQALYGAAQRSPRGIDATPRAVRARLNTRRSAPRDLRIPLPILSPCQRTPNLLRLPVLGRFLKWRHARLAIQAPILLLTLGVVVDGLAGPQAAPTNLAGVVPWIHWRGLAVLGLLVLGNVFCLGCPFLVPRALLRKFFSARRPWPRPLRSKWLAIALLAGFFWAYEAFALWASPWWTAWIVVAYFAGAALVDGCFRGAAFCKYVCPIGQFNFVQALVSPLEVRALDRELCDACKTKDCIRGRDGIPGCELDLYVPQKGGNMDCTLCLDCIHACPHDNIGLVPVVPGADLRHDGPRSGVGAFARRPDLAALVAVLVFAAYVNASGMVGPVLAWQDRLTEALGHPLFVKTALVLTGLLGLPLVVVLSAGALSRWWSGAGRSWVELTSRFTFALLPLGAALWLGHYLFHFVTSAAAIVPVSQRFAADWGLALGTPQWGCGCCLAPPDWLLRLEIVVLDLGLLTALYVAYRLAQAEGVSWGRQLKAVVPWALVMLLLFAWGIWILFQPMEMRGLVETAR